jgi:hypothetical protein
MGEVEDRGSRRRACSALSIRCMESYSEKQLLTRLSDDERHGDGGGGPLSGDYRAVLDRSKPNRVPAVGEAITMLSRLG